MRRLVATMALLTLFAHPARSLTYYFSVTGNDSNNGLTTATPKASLTLIPHLVAEGNSVLLKRGDVWYVDSLGWNFSSVGGFAGSPLLISAYGTGARPVVANMDSGQWAPDGNHVYKGNPPWYHGATDTAEVVRLYLADTPLPRVVAPDSLVDSTYCEYNGQLYVQCAACGSSATFEYMRDESGYLISMDHSSYLTISNIEFKGSAQWTTVRILAPNDHITLDSLYFHQFGVYGIELTPNGYGTTTDKNLAVTISHCTIDQGWSPRMNGEMRYSTWSPWANGTFVTWGAVDSLHISDGININDTADSITVSGCYVTNMGHTGIATEMHNRDNFGVRHVLIEGNTVTAGTSSYCRAIGVGGFETCLNNIVRRNYFHDQNVHSQFVGESTYVYSNIFSGTYASAVGTAIGSGQRVCDAMASYTYNSTDENRRVEESVVIANNTITAADAGFIGNAALGDTSLIGNNIFANNLVVGWRTAEVNWLPGLDVNAAMVSDSGSCELGHWLFKNNGFWKSSTDSIVLAIGKTTSTYDSYTAPALNARPGSSGNAAGDPLFASGDSTAQFALTASSPYTRTGLSLASLLPAGMSAIDYNGRAFGLTGSVGAVQFPYVGLDSIGVSGAPGSPVKLNTSFTASAVLHPSNADIESYAWTLKRGSTVVRTGTASTMVDTLSVAGSYTLSLSATDKLGYIKNAADVSITAFADTIPPATVSDLRQDMGKFTMVVHWTAPGDDGTSGTAAQYDVRYSTSALNSSNFSTTGTAITTGTPDAPGTTECADVSGLSSCTTYYVAIETKDAAGNWSAISNLPNAKTSCSTNKLVSCEDGDRAQPVAEDEAPSVLQLGNPYPNPASRDAVVRFGIPSSASGAAFELAVFDVLGRRVQVLASGRAAPGWSTAQWRVSQPLGALGGAGLYFLRLTVGEKRITRAVIVLK